jgi:hypothetical protein
MTPERIADITFGVLVLIVVIWLLKKPERIGKFCFGVIVLIAFTWILKKAFGH